MEEILNKVFFGNSVLAYIKSLGLLIGYFILIRILRAVVLNRLKKWAEKTETTIDDFIVKVIRKTLVPILYILAIFSALNTLTLSKEIQKGLDYAVIIVTTFFSIKAVILLIDYAFEEFARKRGLDEPKEKQMKSLSNVAKIFVWGIGLIFLLDNVGIDVTTVVAGLGIGGIAVALAAQTILGDLFSYFIIFFDRPFELGDLIKVGDKMGTVIHIGIKTTRLRALDGEELVFSNTDLTNSRLHNFKKLQSRRAMFTLGVIYETPKEKLIKIPAIVEEIINQEEMAQFDRGHFKSYGDFSLNFEFVYYVLSQDYKTYMDIQQRINYKIFEKFKEEGIEFAYPTQLVYVNQTDNN